MNLIDASESPWLLENEDPAPKENQGEIRRLSPQEKEKLRETRAKQAAPEGDYPYPRYITPGLVRLQFINWGFNEGMDDLPIEGRFMSEWFIFT